MANTQKKDNAELHNDAWERFERAVDAAVKSGPKHRTKKKPKPKQRRVKPDRERLSGGEQRLWRDREPKDD